MSLEFSTTVSTATGNVNMLRARCKHLFRDICLLSSLLLGGAYLPAAAQPVEVDRIIAIAEDGIVLKSEFDARWAQVQEQLANQPVAGRPADDVIRKQLLDQL